MKHRFVLVVCLSLMWQLAFGNDILSLDSEAGTLWQVFPRSGAMAAEVSSENFEPDDYVPGIVPGTVFNAYVEAGREADPTYADNIYRTDESKYNQSFWYRTVFLRPQAASGRHTVLVFEGINRYATVYLNGMKLGTIKGHVLKVRYDITALLKDKNVLAVRIDMPADGHIEREENFVNYVCPTYVAAHSWDWTPYVPGLDCGITNDVYLELAGDVNIRDPWVRTTALDDSYSSATLNLQTSVVNMSGAPVQAVVKAKVSPGDYEVNRSVALETGDSVDVSLGDVLVRNPELWWPNGSGQQNLYTCRFEVEIDGKTVDEKSVDFGIRKYEYRKENTALTLYVNGKKVYCKGGNWGMSDFLLRCHGKEYDTRLRLHQDMNYNMIRLWTGCVTDEEFYEACDRYGIMVWDDFWLTGPYTGLTGPDDRKEFMSNVRDKVIRLRNHPSIAVWCGCNEGWPYKELDAEIVETIGAYDGNDRLYLPNSHNGYLSNDSYQAKDGTGYGLSGSGWWTNFEPHEYFATGIWGGGGDQGDKVDWGFRTELGMGAFTTFESFKEFMPEEYWWPRNEMWEKHFFSDNAAYGGAANASRYYDTVVGCYGEPSGIEQFCERAQFVNIEVMKAIYEGWQDNLWNTASGMLFWMSQSAYPCLIWQTYDYYYDMTGTYWGAKKACEPLHIQWNCSNQKVNVVNTMPTDADDLSATIELFRMDGTKFNAQSTVINGISAPANTVSQIHTLSAGNMNLAMGKTAVASEQLSDDYSGQAAFDGDTSTRWATKTSGAEQAWIYVDLGEEKIIGAINLKWQDMLRCGKQYRIQASDDAVSWRDVYVETDGDGGEDYILFEEPIHARYVKMQGEKSAKNWGYVLLEKEVFPPMGDETAIDGMYFIRLRLADKEGRSVSDNFYWTTTKNEKYDYSELNTLPQADVTYQIVSEAEENGVKKMSIQLTNNSENVAFGIRVRLVDAESGKRILPVIMDDNYFTLFGHETRLLNMEYDASLTTVTPQVLLKQYGFEECEDALETGIDEVRTQSDVFLYPNPAVTSVCLQADAGAVQSYRVFSSTGVQVMQGSLQNRIDVSSLPSGMYVMSAVIDGISHRQVFIKR
ncbi:MAG: discoidin domain-containing protein [Prevotella sp.]